MAESVGVENKTLDNGKRKFLRNIGIFGLGAALVAWLGSTVRFLFPQVTYNPPSVVRFDVGSLLNKAKGASVDENGILWVDDMFTKSHNFFLVVSIGKLYALSARCTHLGCTVNWFAAQNVYKCPCHGSQYTSAGENFAGPAPKPLEVFRISRLENNQAEVDTMRKADLFENKSGYFINV